MMRWPNQTVQGTFGESRRFGFYAEAQTRCFRWRPYSVPDLFRSALKRVVNTTEAWAAFLIEFFEPMNTGVAWFAELLVGFLLIVVPRRTNRMQPIPVSVSDWLLRFRVIHCHSSGMADPGRSASQSRRHTIP